MHIDNKNKDILILGFTQSGKRFVLRLRYNGSNSFLFVNATKIYQFKAKDSEIKDYTLCLGNTSKDFTIYNMKKKKKVYKKCIFFLLILILLIQTIL